MRPGQKERPTGKEENDIEHTESSATAHQNVFSIGVHAGYRWFMFRKRENAMNGIYLAPWCSVDYNYSENNVIIQGDQYQQKKLSLFPTIHLGYKF